MDTQEQTQPVKRKPGNPAWTKGKSGNPSGQKRGDMWTGTKIARALLQANAEAIINKCISMALEGDVTALKICTDRVIPSLRDVPRDEDGQVQPLVLNIDHSGLAELIKDKTATKTEDVRPTDEPVLMIAGSK